MMALLDKFSLSNMPGPDMATQVSIPSAGGSCPLQKILQNGLDWRSTEGSYPRLLANV